MLAYFQQLGDAVDAAWGRVDRDPERLPGIAAALLRERPAHEHTALHLVLDWVASVAADRFPTQADPFASFGEPPVTTYWADDFRIDVNIWASSSTAIHQHAFAGAFQVLHGASLEGRYTFRETRRVSGALRLGELSLREMVRHRVGDVSEIAAGAAFIHSLFHLDHPSATVVVRSHGDAAHLPQLLYDPPGVAFDSDLNGIFSPLEHRRLQVVQLVAATRPQALESLLTPMLRDARLLWAYHLLADTLPSALAARGTDFATLDQTMDRWFAEVAWPDADLAAVVRSAGRDRVRRGDVTQRRALFTEPDDRVVAAALRNASDRAAVTAFLAREFPDRDPLAVVLSFIDRGYEIRSPWNPQVCALGLHESSVGVLRVMVETDVDFEGVLAVIADANPEVDLEPQLADLRKRDADLRTFGMFASWFAPARP